MGTTVVELTQVAVEHPLVDGASARTRRLGLFSTFEQAANWLTDKIEREPDDDDALYYVIDVIILDVERQTGPTVVFDRSGRKRGIIPGDTEKPWEGRSGEDCKFKPGQLVGSISSYEETYRVGVIMAQPPTPEEAQRLGATIGDDVYLVGWVKPNDPFNADTFDHDHVRQPLLFEAPSEVSDELREALAHRCLGHEGFPPWTEEATLAKRNPDAVISRVLARFHHDEDTRGKTGGTRATLVLDDSVGFLDSAIKEANFQVVRLTDETDHETRKNILAHRVIVTKNASAYLDDAPVLDFGTIGLDALPWLDASPTYGDNKTAKMISKAVSDFRLASELGAFVVMLHPGGQHVFQRIG